MSKKVLAEFAAEFERCWLCGTKAEETWPPHLEIHHIVRGVSRKKALYEKCVLIRTCQRCHFGYLDSMSIARQLALKWLNEEWHYDRQLVNRLRGRADDAVSESEVLAEVHLLESAAEGTGHPYPRWRI